MGEFAAAIEPLGDKLACALLQLGYFNQSQFATPEDFLRVLEPFLEIWPHDRVPLAAETRNSTVGGARAGLRAAGASDGPGPHLAEVDAEAFGCDGPA